MITADIKENGIPFGHVYVVNQEQLSRPPDDTEGGFYPEPPPWYRYRYEYYRPEHDVIRGTVVHFRPNGAAALLKTVFEDVETKGGK